MKKILFTLLFLLIGSAYATDQSTCGTLSSANTVYDLTGNLNNASTCITVGAANQTLDCHGYSITGTNQTDTYGITSNQLNTTIKNCIISNFMHAIYFNGADNGTIQNVTANSTRANGRGIFIYNDGNYNTVVNSSAYSELSHAINVEYQTSSHHNIISGCNGTSLDKTGIIIASNNNTVINSRGYSSGSTGDENDAGIQIYLGHNNTIINSFGYATAGAGHGFMMNDFSSNNTIKNNLFSSTGGKAIDLKVSHNGNLFVNNTLAGGVTISATCYNNTFYWNNFTSATGAYVTDLNGTNKYNSTEGNIWANVNSNNLTGTGASTGFPNYNVATGGTSYPYNNSTSGGKFVCSFANCGDKAPLFIPNATSGNLTVSATCGATATGNATGISVPSNQSIGLSYIPSNCSFTTWWVASGNCTLNAATTKASTVQVNSGNCSVQANFTTITGFIVINPSYPHTFMFDNGTPFFPLGDTSYFLWNQTDANVTSYINNRSAKGFNVIRVLVNSGNSMHYFSICGGTYNNLNCATTNQTAIDKLRSNLAYAKSKGVYIEMIVYGYADSGGGQEMWATNTSENNYMNALIDEFKNDTGVFMWTIANEFERYPDESYTFQDNDADWAKNVSVKIRTKDIIHPISIHPSVWISEIPPCDMTPNTFRGVSQVTPPTVWQLWTNVSDTSAINASINVMNVQNTLGVACFNGTSGPSNVTWKGVYYNSTNTTDSWETEGAGFEDAAYADYASGKPCYWTEWAYQWEPGTAYSDNRWSPRSVRMRAWKLTTTGCFITAGFSPTAVWWQGANPTSNFRPEQLTIVKEFWVNRTQWHKMAPNLSLVAAGNSLLMRNDSGGKEYVAYFPRGGTSNISMIAGNYSVEWLHPANGTYFTGSNITATAGNYSFTVPSNATSDWVLHLQNISTTTTGGNQTPAANCTHYASPTGIGNGSYATPMNISSFWAVAVPGSKLCLMNGTYNNSASMIVPTINLNGTAALPITVSAEYDGEVLIDGLGTLETVYLNGNNYFIVEGIDVRNSTSSPVHTLAATNIIFRRIVAWDAADGNSGIFIFSYSSNILVEDVGGFGTFRKMYQGGYKDDVNYNPDSNDNLTLRRAWARAEYNTWGGMDIIDIGYNTNGNTVENAIITMDGNFINGAMVGANYSDGFHDGRGYDKRQKFLGIIAYRTPDQSVSGVDVYNYGDFDFNNSVVKDLLMVIEGNESSFGTMLRSTATLNSYSHYSNFTATDMTFIGGPGVNAYMVAGNNISRIITTNMTWHTAWDAGRENSVNATGIFSPLPAYTPSTDYVMAYGNTVNWNDNVTNNSTEDPNLIGRCGNLLQYGCSQAQRPNISGVPVGAQIQCRYVDGNLTDIPLFPFPMDERIRVATCMKDYNKTRADCQTNKSIGVNVTKTVFQLGGGSVPDFAAINPTVCPNSAAAASSNNTTTITAISVIPNPANHTQNVSCNLTATDSALSSMNISGNWTRNGTIILSFNYSNLPNNTAWIVANLTTGNYSAGSNISCRAIATGSNVSSLTTSANLTIQSSTFIQTNGTEAQVGLATSNNNVLWNVNINASDSGTCLYNIGKLAVQDATTIEDINNISITNSGNYTNTNFSCNSSSSPYTISFYTEPIVQSPDQDIFYSGIAGTVQKRILLSSLYAQNINLTFSYTVPSNAYSIRLYKCDNANNASCVSATWTVQLYTILGTTLSKDIELANNETVLIASWDAAQGGGGGGGGSPQLNLTQNTTFVAPKPSQNHTAFDSWARNETRIGAYFIPNWMFGVAIMIIPVLLSIFFYKFTKHAKYLILLLFCILFILLIIWKYSGVRT